MWSSLTAAIVTALSQTLWRLLSPLYGALISEQTSWKRVPSTGVSVLLADLKPATQKSYVAAVRSFHLWTLRQGRVLNVVTDVDLAMFDYMQGCTRSQADILVSAMMKLYPPLRGSLSWSIARAKAIHKAQPPTHHMPLPWLFAVYLAWLLVQAQQPRRAALLLLQWRFGLRPTEAIELRGSDIYICAVPPSRRGPAWVPSAGNLARHQGGAPSDSEGVAAGLHCEPLARLVL